MIDNALLHSYGTVLAQLQERLAEPAPGRVQVLTGPRQVGKTTLLLELAAERGDRAVYAAADAPEASLPGWWEEQWRRMESVAGRPAAVLLLDEIHTLPDWSRRLKGKTDELRRRRTPAHVVVSGSSALRLGAGSRETMAGRFERLQLLHWPARELALGFALAPEKAVEQLVRTGGYPGAVSLLRDPPRWKAYVRDSIIEPAIGRDVLLTETIRRPALLRQVFAIAAAHPSEIVSLQKLCGRLGAEGAIETVAHYLRVLEEAYLVAAIPKFSGREIRRRASPPKLVVLNQALLSAPPEGAPSPGGSPECWGRWIENACLAHAWNAGQTVTYWREEPLEVDGITEGTWGKWALEVKTGRGAPSPQAGLLEFCRRNPGWRPLLLCDPGHVGEASSAGVETQSWQDYLLNGPNPGGGRR
ncbi:MAG: ATP-binding protein [Planctomycetes bacterium]|nr:ATP-binding protein [Planctomycetota bacterium]